VNKKTACFCLFRNSADLCLYNFVTPDCCCLCVRFRQVFFGIIKTKANEFGHHRRVVEEQTGETGGQPNVRRGTVLGKDGSLSFHPHFARGYTPSDKLCWNMGFYEGAEDRRFLPSCHHPDQMLLATRFSVCPLWFPVFENALRIHRQNNKEDGRDFSPPVPRSQQNRRRRTKLCTRLSVWCKN